MEFTKISKEELQANVARRNRKSKYESLVVALGKARADEAFVLEVPEGSTLSKLHINISNALKNKVKARLVKTADGKLAVYRRSE